MKYGQNKKGKVIRQLAAKLANICVSRFGASVALPLRQEVEESVY
jgi:hypothetical protein